MMHAVALFQHPLGDLAHRHPGIPQVCGTVDQHPVAGGAAQRVDHRDLPLRIFLPQGLGRLLGIFDRRCHPRSETDMQNIALLQERLKEIQVLERIEL